MGKLLPVVLLILLLLGGWWWKNHYFEQVETPMATASFLGKLPCADCPGIEESLILYEDNTYVLKDVYLEKNTSYENKGTWSVIKGTPDNPEATVYQLVDNASLGKVFYLLKDNSLKPLEPQTMKEIVSPFNQSLVKQ